MPFSEHRPSNAIMCSNSKCAALGRIPCINNVPFSFRRALCMLILRGCINYRIKKVGIAWGTGVHVHIMEMSFALSTKRHFGFDRRHDDFDTTLLNYNSRTWCKLISNTFQRNGNENFIDSHYTQPDFGFTVHHSIFRCFNCTFFLHHRHKISTSS